jgi:hypothetical protein
VLLALEDSSVRCAVEVSVGSAASGYLGSDDRGEPWVLLTIGRGRGGKELEIRISQGDAIELAAALCHRAVSE